MQRLHLFFLALIALLTTGCNKSVESNTKANDMHNDLRPAASVSVKDQSLAIKCLESQGIQSVCLNSLGSVGLLVESHEVEKARALLEEDAKRHGYKITTSE